MAAGITISSKERDRIRASFLEEKIATFHRAGKKVPRGYRDAFKSNSPTARAWLNITSNGPQKGRSGASVDAEWLCPVLGRHRFTARVGVRPYRGRATNGRKDTSKPWGPRNFQWVKPKEQPEPPEGDGLTAAERVQARKALAARRREHGEFLVHRAKLEFGLDLARELFKRPGTSGLYRIWKNIISRCEAPRNHNYSNYGGRGIEVAPLFSSLNEFAFEDYVFYACSCPELGPRPGPEYSTERKDVDGNYEVGNLTWATPEEQLANRREVVKLQMTAEEKAEARRMEQARSLDLKADRNWAAVLASGTWKIGGDGEPEPVITGDEVFLPEEGQPWPI